MFDKTAQWYDAVYTSIKDYAKEAEELHELIRRECPQARSLLDVACGTGLHDQVLSARFQVTGVDLDTNMLALARERNPSIEYREGDMTSFDVGRRFDAVVCLFSSVAYVRTPERLDAAVSRMAAHVEPGGVLVLEPWITPDRWEPGRPHAVFVDEPELKIARMSVAEPIVDGEGTLRFHYLVATPEEVSRIDEEHRVGFFSHEQYVAAFERAGLTVRTEDGAGWAGRGIYVGRTGA